MNRASGGGRPPLSMVFGSLFLLVYGAGRFSLDERFRRIHGAAGAREQEARTS